MLGIAPGMVADKIRRPREAFVDHDDMLARARNSEITPAILLRFRRRISDAHGRCTPDECANRFVNTGCAGTLRAASEMGSDLTQAFVWTSPSSA